MTDDREAAGIDRDDRDDLDRQVRDRYGTWRDQPRGLGCAVVAAFLALTTVAAAVAVVLLIAAA